MANKEKNQSKLASGHGTCAGCPAPLIVRTVLDIIEDPVVVSSATGCLEVATTIYPKTSWNVPFIHSAFENASATISGVETAYRVLKKKYGKENQKSTFQNKSGFELKDKMQFVVFGGDGGTYDIGLQSLSGALERGHNFLYICYNNEGYMNTGGQRSGATSRGARTTTTPPGTQSYGKIQLKKDLMEIVEAHHIPYLAQASVFNLIDLKNKVKKALTYEGPKFINILSPCPTIWKFPGSLLKEVIRLAVDTRFWPIYEVEEGKHKVNYLPKKETPVEEFLKLQKRFAHLFKDKNKEIINQIQAEIDQKWERLLKR